MNHEPQGGILRRAVRNSGLLLSGKSLSGIMQLAIFAIAARALGVHDFGIFSAITAQIMLLTGLAAFDTNQAIIRYGVPHLNAEDRAGFQALIKAGTLLDLGAATFAMLVCILVAPIVGARLGWSRDLVMLAQLAAPLSYANAISTPKGMLRLFGRFDLLTTHSTVVPAIRLVAVAILALTKASLFWYVIAWLIAGWGGAAAGFWFGWREARRRTMLRGIDGSLGGLHHRNAGVWRFSIFSNLNSSVGLIPTQLAVLIVASILGAAAAGVFRVAREVGTGMLKPVDVINQTIYPDMARLVATRNWRRLTRAAMRAGITACGVGLAVLLVILFAGDLLVGLIFGKEFVAAVPILTLMALGTSIRVLAFAADPIMYALGRPGYPLVLSLISAVLFIAVMVWRLPIDGAAGAGWAFLVMGATSGLLSALTAAWLIRREQDHDRSLVPTGAIS